MPRKAKNVANNEHASRNYLADEVQAQRRNITELVGAVKGLEASVRNLVEDAREERQSAKEERSDLHKQLVANRMEQQQTAMSVSGLQTDMVSVAKSISEHETDRQHAKWALNLAKASVRPARIIIGLLATAVVALFAWIMKFAPHFSSQPPPGGHP